MTSFDEIKELWNRIRTLYQKLGHDEPERFFRPGATEPQIAALEAKLGFQFPQQLRDSYKVHRDTLDAPFEPCIFIPFGEMPQTIEQRNSWLKHRPPIKLSPGTRPPVFGPQLIPFGFGNDTAFCVDLNPGEGGTVGQVVAVSFHRATTKVLAESFAGFLRFGIASMEKELAKIARAERKRSGEERKPAQPASNPLGALNDILRLALGGPKAVQQKSAERLAEHLAKMPPVKFGGIGVNHGDVRESRRNEAPVQFDAETLAWQAKLAPLWAELRKLGESESDTFEPGYGSAHIEDLERELGFALPPELRAHYLIHAWVGQAWGNIRFEELETLKQRCGELNASAADAEFALFPGTRRPHFGAGNLLPLNGEDPAICVDLNPGKGGVKGQIVQVDFQDATCQVLAGDFAAFLKRGIAELRAELKGL